VCNVLLAVLKADAAREFTQKVFAESGVGQYRQALQLLSFLDLLDSRRRLQKEVVESRRDFTRFKALVRQRLKTACTGAPDGRLRCGEDELSFLGTQRLGKADLGKRLESLPPIEQHRQRSGRSAMIRAMAALHDFLLDAKDREWLEEGAAGTTETPRRAETGGAAAKPSAAGPNGGKEATLQQRPAAGRQTCLSPAAPCGTAGVVYHQYVPIGFTAEQDPICVQLWLDRELSSEELARVGKHFLAEARLKQGEPRASHADSSR
jgi:hypothetical protein